MTPSSASGVLARALKTSADLNPDRYATSSTRKSQEISVLQRAYRPRATENEET